MAAIVEEMHLAVDRNSAAYVTAHINSKHSSVVVQSEEQKEQQSQLSWGKRREYCRYAFSEFFGTMILLLFGNGVIAQVLLSHGEKGDYLSISLGWG